MPYLFFLSFVADNETAKAGLVQLVGQKKNVTTDTAKYLQFDITV